MTSNENASGSTDGTPTISTQVRETWTRICHSHPHTTATSRTQLHTSTLDQSSTDLA